ncbi:MAG: ArdC family protein, partial [Eubacteriales bacterium]|nr:ArdC family protein [Eubacteriales bacterium]
MNESKVEELRKDLEKGISEVFESGKYKEYLSLMSKFHGYSFRNTMLIKFFKPDATRVAGFVKWQNEFGRSVKRGETGIPILAPSVYKKDVEETKRDEKGSPVLDRNNKVVIVKKEVSVPYFRVVTVFDVSQTEGPDLPVFVKELDGSMAQGDKFLAAIIEESPYSINFEDIAGGARGCCNYLKKEIAIKKDMSQAQTIKTAVHEVAHCIMHENAKKEEGLDSRTKEVQAESVAYIVSKFFGLDASEYSFNYIA